MTTPETGDLHGFQLRSVCWGYRDLFRRALDGLLDQGLLDPGREESARRLFEFLKQADQSCFDHVLKEFLVALNPRTRWLLDLPGVFGDVIDLGRAFAEHRLHHGIGYFRRLGDGALGGTPAELQVFINQAGRLRAIDADLAFAFVCGYRTLCERLAPDEIPRFVNEGVRVFTRSPATGLRFIEAGTGPADRFIRVMTQECRLEDVSGHLDRLLRALVGGGLRVAGLGELDSDHLIERGCNVVCVGDHLYLPQRVRRFARADANRHWYVLAALTAAAMLLGDGFPRIHGQPGCETVADTLATPDRKRVNLLVVLELVRATAFVRERWPGARRVLGRALADLFGHEPVLTGATRLLRSAVDTEDESQAGALVRDLARRAVNVIHAARLVEGRPAACEALREAGAGGVIPALGFFPDLLFPAEQSVAPPGQLVVDLKSAADRAEANDGQEPDVEAAAAGSIGGVAAQEAADGEAAMRAGFLYDEWSAQENEYLRDHCLLHERRVEQDAASSAAPVFEDEARAVRRAFERLKPDAPFREKRLAEGDYLNADLLVEYLVERHREPSPKVRFYERPRINRRDLAVLLLLDISGSTGEREADRQILEVEKQAALLLGAGLHTLGDPFSICGFSGEGRENCEYLVFKEFEEPWAAGSIGRVLAARPLSSTRMGVALRHSGMRLNGRGNRRRLLIVITDGRPMDSGYDPKTRYAQHDVRMACHENDRMEVRTFAISTEENSRRDMEIMFPGRRFMVLPSIAELPRVLPRLYLAMTV